MDFAPWWIMACNLNKLFPPNTAVGHCVIAIPETKLEPTASKSCHEFPTMVECIPENWVQINHKHFYLELCFLIYIYNLNKWQAYLLKASTPNFITWEIRPSAFGFGSGRNSILRKNEEPGYRGPWKLDFHNALPQEEILKRKKSRHFCS